MWLDEITISARGGKGGDGAVHFARRKFEPFAGPDGGDGGKGGDVVLVGKRDLDTLYSLHTALTQAASGAPGGPNQMIGINGVDCEIGVPLGTIAYDAQTGFERGALVHSGMRLVAAHGGKGGKGNPHYATGRRRAPKMYETGWEGERLDLLLRYRIYAGTALIEPLGAGVLSQDWKWLLLPRLLKRDAGGIEFDLYRRKPRWARLETDFNKYDIAYLPVLFDADAGGILGCVQHAYWAEALIINLAPLSLDEAQAWWLALKAQLAAQPWRRLEACACILPPGSDGSEWTGKIGGVEITAQACDAPDELLGIMQPHVRGGPVV
jgi:hypothetical protein